MAVEWLLLLAKLSFVASAAILVVLALRAAMRSLFGARVAYALWLVVPAAIVAALLPVREIIVGVLAAKPLVASGVVAAKDWLATTLPIGGRPDASILILSLWIAGVVLALTVLAWRQIAFTESLGKLRCEGKGVFRSDAFGIGPAIVGVIWPKLVLPSDFEARFDAEECDMVLTHERVHLHGHDPMINGLAAMVQCLNWFNPLVHLAATLMRVDQELACDAAVMSKFPKARRRYAEAILKAQIAPSYLPLGCYWPAGGTYPLKQRIAMLKRGLPSTRRVVAGAFVAAAACLTTGCVVWVAQPPREVNARNDSASSKQGSADADLLGAVWSGNLARAKQALASGASANAQTGDGLTALAITARSEDMGMLNLLLEHGADVNLISPGEGNALMAGAKRGHVFAVAALVEHGAVINAAAPGFGTPLAAAARTGHEAVVKYLVEHGADVHLASPRPAPWGIFGGETLTPLQFAIDSDQGSIVAYLKSKGAEM